MNLYNVLNPILSEARKTFIRKIELGLFKLEHYSEEGNEIKFLISIEGFLFHFSCNKEHKVIFQDTSDINLYKTYFNEDYDAFMKYVKDKRKEYKDKEKELINSLEETLLKTA